MLSVNIFFIFGTSADHLPAILGGEVSARDLGEDVAVEEAGEDEALGLGVPVKVGHLQVVIIISTQHRAERPLTVAVVPLL